jgi:hypothetical protein
LWVDEGRPIDRRGVIGAMRRDDDEPRSLVAEGERKACLGGASECCRDAWHDHHRNAGGAQMLELFAAASEHERIAALEPHHALAGARRLHQAAVDLLLADAALPATLADEHALGLAARPVEHVLGHQLVVEDDVGILQRMQRP